MKKSFGCLDKAIMIATEAHFGLRDKAGAPYILHPMRVMMAMDTIEGKIVGILHDTIEDTDVTLVMLLEEGLSEKNVHSIDCMTRRKGETYQDFLVRIVSDEIASECKLKDMRDNGNIFRLHQVERKHLSMIKKYHKGAKFILEHRPEMKRFFTLIT